MSHVKRLKVVTTAERMAAVWPDGEPLIDSTRRTLGLPYYFIGDAATMGAKLIARDDDVVHMDWPTHNRTLPASGIDVVVSDGTTLTDAQALLSQRPSFYIVDVPNNDEIGIVTTGTAWLPNTNLIAGEFYYLDSANPNALVTTEPQLSIPVCEILRTSGTGAWASFMLQRSWDRGTTSTALPSYTAARIVITSGANTGNTQLFDIQFRETPGVEQLLGAGTPFTDSLRVGFGPERAFDAPADPTAWVCLQNPVFPVMVGAMFPAARTITQIALTHEQNFPVSNRPLTWNAQGSNDTTNGINGTWTTIHTEGTDIFATPGQKLIDL